jgi:hypothetical protein
MTENKIHHIIVVSNSTEKDFVGLVSSKDLAKNISKTSKNGIISKLFEIKEIKKLEKSKKIVEGLEIIKDMNIKFLSNIQDYPEKEVISKFKKMLEIWDLNDHQQLKGSIPKYIQYSYLIKKFRETGEGLSYLDLIRCEKNEPEFTEELLLKRFSLLCSVLEINDPKKKDLKVYVDLIKDHQSKTGLYGLDYLYENNLFKNDLKKFSGLIHMSFHEEVDDL